MTPELIMMIAIWVLTIAAGVCYLFGMITSRVTSRYIVRTDEAQVSSVPVLSSDEAETKKRTDGRTDVGPSALGIAIKNRRLDVIREVIIDTLIQDGADVELVRKLLKGSNDAIGQEVAASRDRLGITPPERKLMVRDETGEREIAF